MLGVLVIGALETEGRGKGQGHLVYENPNGFEELESEEEKEGKNSNTKHVRA